MHNSYYIHILTYVYLSFLLITSIFALKDDINFNVIYSADKQVSAKVTTSESKIEHDGTEINSDPILRSVPQKTLQSFSEPILMGELEQVVVNISVGTPGELHIKQKKNLKF